MTFHYLSPEWTQEAYRRLKEELTPEKMKFVTSSMVTFYKNCPDGKDRALFYRFVNGVCSELAITSPRRLRTSPLNTTKRHSHTLW